MAFEKRLDELDEKEILAGLSGVTFERRGELLVVDVLEADGTWDLRDRCCSRPSSPRSSGSR